MQPFAIVEFKERSPFSEFKLKEVHSKFIVMRSPVISKYATKQNGKIGLPGLDSTGKTWCGISKFAGSRDDRTQW